MARPEFAGMRKVKLSGTARSCYWRFHTKNVTEGGAPARLHSHGSLG